MTPAKGVSQAARALLDRVRSTMPADSVREVRMFGAVALMVRDAMLVAVHQDGSLLARVSPDEDSTLVTKPHARRAEMGAGRSMGAGWIRVDADGVEDDEALEEWVAAAQRLHATREATGQPGRPR